MGRSIKDLIITKDKDFRVEKGTTTSESYKDLYVYTRYSRSWHLIEDNLISKEALENSLIVILDDYLPNELKVIFKGKEIEETIDIFWCDLELEKKAVRDFCAKYDICFESMNTKEIEDLIISEFITD